MSDEAVTKVVIVGGGTAGWLTAGVLAADHCAASDHGLSVTVIESPRIPILGVGEGTWPSLRDTLRRIGLGETAFIRRCDASFKQGSRFDGWRDGAPGDSYFHPFSAPPDADAIDALALWRSAPEGTVFADALSAQPAACRAGRAPKQAATPEYAAVSNYAYHLDAPAFAEMLREHCTDRLGVRLIRDDMTGVRRGETGDVEAVETAEHGAVEADLFVDCTGSRALLIGEAMGVPVRDATDVLFNDAALALHVPYARPDDPIESQTNAAAAAAGWIWDIALQSRRGVGHVFATAFADEEAARRDLAAYLAKTAPGSGARAEDARLIRFSSAYREAPWTGNVVGVGMAQGFVEPLEASAIVMIELSAAMISDTLPPRRSLMGAAAARFNARFAYRWGRIVDFLKLHYVLSARGEPYWRAHQDVDTWPDRLRELIALWRRQAPSREDFPQAREIFPAASYAYVLYGMGFKTDAPATRRRRDDPRRAGRFLQETAVRTRRLLEGLPANRALLDHITDRGLTRV